MPRCFKSVYVAQTQTHCILSISIQATHDPSQPCLMGPHETGLDWICTALLPFFFEPGYPFSNRRRAGLRGAIGEHLASEGHGGSAGVLFNEVEDQDAQL